MDYFVKKEKHHFNQYENVTDYLEHIRSPINSTLSRTSTRLGNTYLDTKTQTLEEALELAEKGWPEGLERIAEFSAVLNEQVTGYLLIQEMHYDVTGDVLDIGRFVSEEPEDFGSLRETEVPTDSLTPKIVNVVMNLATSASMSTYTMELRGAACVALCDALERHGKRVDLDMVFASQSHTPYRSDETSGVSVNAIVRVKNSYEPLQLDKLAFILAHPSSCRRLAWASVEHMPDDVRIATGFNGGYCGLPCDSQYLGDITMEKALGGSGWSHEQTLEWILKTLQAQGIEVRKEARVGG